MAINLGNVNISIQEFHRLSHGDFNAGEVKLAGEHKLAKMNHHVYQTDRNDEVISHAEVLTIKAALVKALSNNGIGQAELDRIRKDLGLAPDGLADKNLRHRSVMPLSRQKIREILDRNAADINAFCAANHVQGVNIRTTRQMYGFEGMGAENAEMRDNVNNALLDDHRKVNANADILRLQTIVTDTADFTTGEERRKVLETAKAQLDEIMRKGNYEPSADRPATATLDLGGGHTLSIPTGLSERQYADRLENLIVRFEKHPAGPNSQPFNEREFVDGYMKMGSAQRKEVMQGLPNDPQGGLKARTLAIRSLYTRDVRDHAILSLANRLNDYDAIAFAIHVLRLPAAATPDDIANDGVLRGLAAKPPADLPREAQAYVPATSSSEYNRFVEHALGKDSADLPGDFRKLAEDTKALVRQRLGEKAMPQGAHVTLLFPRRTRTSRTLRASRSLPSANSTSTGRSRTACRASSRRPSTRPTSIRTGGRTRRRSGSPAR